VVKDGWVNENGIGTIYGPILNIAPETALIVYQE